MKKLLLVEDNEHLMAINADFLEESGYQVTKAFTLKEAERCLSESEPDLLVLDVMLPDGDGVSFCSRIRRETDLPVLFLTAKSSPADIVNGLREGGDDYLTKPYDLNVLAAHIEACRQRTLAKGEFEALLRRSVPRARKEDRPERTKIRIGPLLFDAPVSLAYADGRLLNLTAKEYGTLFVLAKRHDSVVPAEELYRAVWGQDMLSDNSALWTAVSRLKKKIAPYAHRFALESSHKGYMLTIRKE